MSSSVAAPADPRSAHELLREFRSLRRQGGTVLPWLTLMLRLPQVIAPLGVLTWIATTTGQAWTAALTSASVCLGSALCGMLIARAVTNRLRQWGLLALAAVQAVFMWRLPDAAAGTADVSWDTVTLFVPFFVAGMTLPPAGLPCRLRWSMVLQHRDRDDLFPAAMRLESINESMAVVIGATLTGLLAVTAGADTVLRVSAVLTVVTTIAFLLHPSARFAQSALAAHRPRRRRPRGRARLAAAQRLRRVLVAGCAGLAALVGAIQGCLVVYTVSLETVVSLGGLYAMLGLAAAASAVLTVSWRTRVSAWNLWVLFATAALLSTMLLSAPSGVPGFAAVLAMIGLCTGPCLVCLFSLAAYVAPRETYLGVLSSMTSAVAAGTAAGLVLSTYLGVRFDYISAALVPVAMAMVTMACGLVFIYAWRRSPLHTDE